MRISHSSKTIADLEATVENQKLQAEIDRLKVRIGHSSKIISGLEATVENLRSDNERQKGERGESEDYNVKLNKEIEAEMRTLKTDIPNVMSDDIIGNQSAKDALLRLCNQPCCKAVQPAN